MLQFERGPSKVRLQRLRRGIPLIVLAQKLDLSPATISHFERGLATLTEKQEAHRKKLLGVRGRVVKAGKRAGQ